MSSVEPYVELYGSAMAMMPITGLAILFHAIQTLLRDMFDTKAPLGSGAERTLIAARRMLAVALPN